MAPTLAQRHLPRPARDWAEIQERMLVPLYEAVYERFEVGRHTHVLGLGCGSGLALVMAAILAPVGILLGCVVALVADRRSRRGTRP